jgi:transketolase
MRKACLDMVYELAAQDERIVFVGSDLGAGTLDAFKQRMPERFFMEGVSEATVLGVAAGLAMEGKIVYANTIATFITRRCFEQIVVDLCLHRANVRLIGNGGGLVYAPLGPTHLAIDDLAILRALPNMAVVAPADANEMRRCMRASVEHRGPLYIRLAKGGDPLVTPAEGGFEIGKAVVMREGDEALLVTTGITLQVALEAAAALSGQGIEAGLLHCPTVKPFDAEALLRAAAPVSAVVTMEEHTVMGGLGGAVAEVLAEANLQPAKRFRRIGIPDVFPDRYGSQAGLMKRYGITAERAAAVVTELLGHARKPQVEWHGDRVAT